MNVWICLLLRDCIAPSTDGMSEPGAKQPDGVGDVTRLPVRGVFGKLPLVVGQSSGYNRSMKIGPFRICNDGCFHVPS
jgi:hypothetical protein